MQKKKPDAILIELKAPCRGPTALTPPMRNKIIPIAPDQAIHSSPVRVIIIINAKTIGSIPHERGYKTAFGFGFKSTMFQPNDSGDVSLALTILITTRQMDDVGIDFLLRTLHQPCGQES